MRFALLAVLGVVELLFPKQLVDVVTRLSYDIEGDVEPKPWLYTAARVEGATILVFALWKLLSRSKDVDVESDVSA